MGEKSESMLGAYGDWAGALLGDHKLSLSFLDAAWLDLGQWRAAARTKVLELLAPPYPLDSRDAAVEVRRGETRTREGLAITSLSWQLPYGPETQAVLIAPAHATGRLPGVLALHDHGGVKYFGKRKIIRTLDAVHPFILEHQKSYYGGRAWANELARRGFAVLVHDVFAFGSRRIMAADLPGFVVDRMMAAPEETQELGPDDLRGVRSRHGYDVPPDEPIDRIRSYDAFGGAHETIVAKALFSAGLTWPGVFLYEDRTALDVLCSLPEVDSDRVGCCGLSGGGLRTNYLAGIDDRIRCSVTVGFMTTWRDFLLHTCHTHTWMIYIPRLPRFMDYPDILSMRAPLPAMVQASEEDPLFTPGEVRRAADRLRAIYGKADADERFVFTTYPGPHQFNEPMQRDAFSWIERWLEPHR